MNFSVVLFVKKDHLHIMMKWLEYRKLPKAPATFLPPTGLVVMWNGMPVCMGFLIKCDNNMGIFTDFVSDIGIAKNVRNEAVEFLRSELTKEARSGGIIFLTSFTSLPRHKKRLQSKLGWVRIDDNLAQFGRFLNI